MSRHANLTKTALRLTLAAILIFAGASLAPALTSDPPAPETPQGSPDEVATGGCRWRAQEAGDSGCGAPCAEMGRHRGAGRTEGGNDGQGCRRGRNKGMGMGEGPGRGGDRNPMAAVHALVHDYRHEVVREVENLANGVVTVTRIEGNPEAVATLHRHVAEMKDLLATGGRIRGWDPLFREIFDHYDEIDMVVEELPDGVRVTETSADPEVVKLIQAHARKVDEFVARGPAAVHESTPLPEGYRSGG